MTTKVLSMWPHGRQTRLYEDNIKTYITEITCKDHRWVELAWNSVQLGLRIRLKQIWIFQVASSWGYQFMRTESNRYLRLSAD